MDTTPHIAAQYLEETFLHGNTSQVAPLLVDEQRNPPSFLLNAPLHISVRPYFAEESRATLESEKHGSETTSS